MKKSITLISTVALATIIASSASADTINGIQVTSNNGHTITLANGQTARIDNGKVYIDNVGEVILAPDVVPPKIPNQQTPPQSLTPTQSTQGVPTKPQQTPNTPVVPNTPNQQTPTKTPNTPVIPSDPKVPTHNSVAVPPKTPNAPVKTPDPVTPKAPNQQTPTKTPNDPKIPTSVTENVPVKTYPQNNNQGSYPTQTDDLSHTTKIEKEKTKPITVPDGITKPSTTPATPNKTGAGTKASTSTKVVASTSKSSASYIPKKVVKEDAKKSTTKAKDGTVKVTYQKVESAKNANKSVPTLDTLPVTGDSLASNVWIFIGGALIAIGVFLVGERTVFKKKGRK